MQNRTLVTVIEVRNFPWFCEMIFTVFYLHVLILLQIYTLSRMHAYQRQRGVVIVG